MAEMFEYIAPCHFGLEAVLKREIRELGYEIVKVDNGKVTFRGDAAAAARANIFLRTPERILLKAAEFRAENFDELFEGTKNIKWEEFIPKNGKFWVKKANSIRSRNHSPRDIQSIMKKAMVNELSGAYGIKVFPETGAEFPLRVTIMNDTVTVGIDTSGESLHKRGYRKAAVKAPITETLAAALIMLTPWKADRILADPFCGSGTFPIEAAMIGAHIAPGMNRRFTAEEWTGIIPKKVWYRAADEAEEMIDRDILEGGKTDIQGFDIDPHAVEAARANAADAGVEKMIHFQQRPLEKFSHRKKYGFIITNPPYGERLEEKKDLPDLYRQIGEVYRSLDSWSMYLITAFEDAERYIGKRADKNRKIYNGMMQTRFYQYSGPRPPRRNRKM